MYTEKEYSMIWFSLLIEQQNQKEGSSLWFQYENLIRKIEKELGMHQRPKLRVVKNEGN